MIKSKELWIIGADDFASETQACDGWTFFGLPEPMMSSFEHEGRQILNRFGLSSFHGKKYRYCDENAFTAFLQLIRKMLDADCRACNSLIDQKMKSTLAGFAQKIVSNSIKQAVLGSEENAKVTAAYAPVLFTALRVLQPLGSQRQIRLYLDENTSLPKMIKSKIIVIPPQYSCPWLLQKTVNAYRNSQFPNAPEFADNPVETMKDSQSMLIQAADVLGNFSMSYVFIKLGNRSKKRAAKAQLFANVFGDTFERFDFSSSIVMQGNDIYLKEGGSLTLQIGLEPNGSE